MRTLSDKLKEIEDNIDTCYEGMTVEEVGAIRRILELESLTTIKELDNLKNDVIQWYKTSIENIKDDYFFSKGNYCFILTAKITYCIDARKYLFNAIEDEQRDN